MESNIVFKEISLENKDLIKSYLAKETFLISDITFGNLFIWRHARKIEYAIVKDCLIIKTTYEGKNPFIFFPIGEGDKKQALLDLKTYFQSSGERLELHSVESKNLELLKELFPDAKVELNRDRSDYVYVTKELIELKGRKFHKKKNHFNRFLEEHAGFTYEPMSEANLEELIELQTKWHKLNDDPSDKGLYFEHVGIIDVFKHFDKLGLEGGLIRCSGNIMAFSFGEIATNEMCVIHIEKADISYRGAYQAINQQLLSHAFSMILYANREEDLGIEGLRKAKLSYNPTMIVEKYEVLV
ncbi:phosphatidylglycerol lysyltransferase domain-containing protein [Helicobacter sp. 11S02629-2]|uniref:DUF2156 domain-containing protein n=1 Tax=Helicobacter sp. 11S02629-2 TaxID=1476195 RepID=UPI000BA5B712|nr:phosphatidylglycerol lysyltransferase domain-containing protein [Helicobacter sp. 11S02629-2]PAF44592.1 hypothetical protein BKH40_04995 [Helicobacter sp. 11S02629-2]